MGGMALTGRQVYRGANLFGAAESESVELPARVSCSPGMVHPVLLNGPNRLLSRSKKPLSTIENLAKYYAPLDNPSRIKSSHALDILAEISAQKPDGRDTAIEALNLLATKYDPIRTNYWNHRKSVMLKAVAA